MKVYLPKRELKIFFRSGFLLTVASVAVGVLGYLFQILVGRMLEPSDFAIFSALLALYVLLSSPFSALNMMITRRVSMLYATKNTQLSKIYYWVLHKWAAILGLTTFCLIYLYSDFIIEYIRAQSLSQLLIFTTLLIFSFFLVINNSFLQGFHLFEWQAISNVCSAFMKLLLGISFIALGLNINGAILGVSLSAAFGWTVGAIVLLRLFSKTKNTTTTVMNEDINNLRSIFQVLGISISFAAMTQLDMILVNRFFSPSEAGEYAAASVLGKAVLYIPSGLIAVLFPMTIEAHINKINDNLLLKAALISTLLICGLLALIYLIWSDQIIYLIYGDAYFGAGSILRWYGFAILPMALVMVFEHYLIAKGKLIFSWFFLFFGPLQVCAIYLFHDRLIHVLLAVGVSGLLLFLSGSIMSYRYLKENKKFNISN